MGASEMATLIGESFDLIGNDIWPFSWACCFDWQVGGPQTALNSTLSRLDADFGTLLSPAL